MGQALVAKGRGPVDGGAESEAELVGRIRARDGAAFERLYKSFHPRLARFLLNMTHRPELVEEVLNDTMMVVWSRIEGFAGASRLSTWIFGIAYRQALTALRRLDEPVEHEPDAEEASPLPSPERLADREGLRGRLATAVDGLSPAHRAVVNLTYFQDTGYKEIAEIMECPVDTVKTRMFHARRHLRQALPGDFADWA